MSAFEEDSERDPYDPPENWYPDENNLSPQLKAALRDTVESFVLWTDSTPHSNEPTELGVYFKQLDEGEVVDRLADELATALQSEIERLELEAQINILREVVDNPNRRSYYMELLNEGLKRRKQLTQSNQEEKN